MYCPGPESSNTAAHITATPPERDNSSQQPVGSIQPCSAAAISHIPQYCEFKPLTPLHRPSHSTVNHSLHFIDPGTGIHTQNVKSYWNRVKGKFKRMKGVHEEMMSSYLDEFMLQERHGPTASTVLTNFC